MVFVVRVLMHLVESGRVNPQSYILLSSGCIAILVDFPEQVTHFIAYDPYS